MTPFRYVRTRIKISVSVSQNLLSTIVPYKHDDDEKTVTGVVLLQNLINHQNDRSFKVLNLKTPLTPFKVLLTNLIVDTS